MKVKSSVFSDFKLQILILMGAVGLMWGLEIVDQVLFQGACRGVCGLDIHGIVPRTRDGLWGIVWAPFLHGDFAHLIGNTIPFVILSWLIMLSGVGDWLIVTIVSALVGGLGTWLFADFISGDLTVHIGASGVIFGYFGFILARGYFERSFVSIAIAALVTFMYGGLILGVLPGQEGISWQGHLFGFLGGMTSAWLFTKPRSTSNYDL
ncbi:MAG: rhomboid family intramembrane serine protease [Phormidesmis sp.]